MPTHWEPESWDIFRESYAAGECRVVLLKRAREWAKQRGWRPKWFGFEQDFIERLLRDESSFREAYNANVFALYEKRPRDLAAVVQRNPG